MNTAMNRGSRAGHDGPRRRARRAWALLWLVAVALSLGVDACGPSAFPLVVPDDAGTRAWVRQVVPILLGRKVKGALEVKVLADIATATDRPTVLRALMAQPEFVDHWSEMLINTLRVDREGTKVQSDCYGPPLRASDGAALAQHILANAVGVAAPGGAFNMSDVVRSAIVADNLAPLYRAHLFALQHKPLFGNSQQTRDDLGLVFGEVFLNRQNTCLACHNSDSSTTDDSSGWGRFFPVLGSFEQALYGAATGGDPAAIHEMFRTDQQSTGAGFVAPWGMSSCGQFRADMGSSLGVNPYFTGALAPGATMTTLVNRFKSGYDSMASGGLHRTVPSSVQAACTACQTSCSGATPLDPEAVTNGIFVRDLLTAHAGASDCGNCHGPTQGLWFYPAMAGEKWYTHLINVPANELAMGIRVIPGNAADSVLVRKLKGTLGTTMPLGGSPLSAADIQKVEAWINALPSSATCVNCPTLDCERTHVEGDEAFAYLAAARIVNTVWQETMGHPLTIANYFPRNSEQRGVLWNLTESTFVPSGWSLRSLLVRILTANTFNRQPPDTETGSSGPYREPRLFDPWQIPDPRVAPANLPGWQPSDHPDLYNNAMTDGVYRYPTVSLLRSTQRALDWPGPARFPSSAYPDEPLERAMGQYFSGDSPGFRSTNFAALLLWEKEHGLCANHRSSGQDWIDRLAAAAVVFTPAPGDPPLTLRDLVAVERDWLLGDGTIGTAVPPGATVSEEQALTALLGPLTATFAPAQLAELSGRLRSACGVLIETPQFFLAGIAPDGPGSPPRLRVCNGAPCSYQEMCQEVAGRATLPNRQALICNADSVVVLSIARPPRLIRDLPISRFCPQCPVIQLDPTACFQPVEGVRAAACNVAPPSCNPSCSRIDCCGGPISTLTERSTVILDGDGALVKSASGVRVRRAGSEKVAPLEAGARLGYGDLLELQPGAELVLDRAGSELRYAADKAAREAGDPPRYVMVSGKQATEKLARTRNQPRLSAERLAWMRKAGWLKNPDGSTPVVITPEMRGPGAAEKAWAEHLKTAKP